MPSLRPIIPITEDRIVEMMSPADSSLRSRSLSFRERIDEAAAMADQHVTAESGISSRDTSNSLSAMHIQVNELNVITAVSEAKPVEGLDFSALMSKLVVLQEECEEVPAALVP